MSDFISEKFEDLKEYCKTFPQSPGVYIMKDHNGGYLYIGKAINLKNRIRNYFSEDFDNRFQIPYLMQRVNSLEWIVTNTETEALILEANLIRSHKPPYNLSLKDDKHFPYLKITMNEMFPKLLITRKVVDDGARYFGPYTDSRTMRKVYDFAHRLFKLRTSNYKFPQSKLHRPCINYSMGRCSAPCAGKITEEAYLERIEMLIQYLQGKRNDITTALEEKMRQASENLEFERAAQYRDQIQLIAKSASSKVDLKDNRDIDIFGTFKSDKEICLTIMSFKQGILMGQRNFTFKNDTWNPQQSELEALIIQYYRRSLSEHPSEIYLPFSDECNVLLIEEWFQKECNKKVIIKTPKIGAKKDLIKLAEKNARLYLAQKSSVSYEEATLELQKVLNLPRIPHTIEAFDISNLGDKFTVAGMVHFKDGSPVKSKFRRFKIKTVEGQNDFAMMFEAVDRRLSRLLDEGKDFPDLLLIDGGPGQLSSAIKALEKFDDPPMIASLAKKEEILFTPFVDTPVKLPQRHRVRRLVETIRNAVHKQAITYHRKIRDTALKTSTLESIEGIGKKTATNLLKTFGSIKRLKTASAEEIAEKISGFSVKKAEKLLHALHNNQKQ